MTGKFLYYPEAFVLSGKSSSNFDLNIVPLRRIVEDLAFLRGYCCVEIMEARNMVVFHEEDHLERLCNSMRELRMSIPAIESDYPRRKDPSFSDFRKFLEEKVRKTLFANFLKKPFSARIFIFVGGGITEDDFRPAGLSSVYIFIRDFNPPEFKKDKALKILAVKYLREFPEAKTNNYAFAESMLPVLSSIDFDDILYARKGNFLECSRGNFFLVKKRRGRTIVKTAKQNVLHGVTRKIVLELAKKKGYEVKEGRVSLRDVVLADEAFITSTTKFVWPVCCIDLNRVSDSRVYYKYVTKQKRLPVGETTLGLRRSFLEYREKYYKEY